MTAVDLRVLYNRSFEKLKSSYTRSYCKEQMGYGFIVVKFPVEAGKEKKARVFLGSIATITNCEVTANMKKEFRGS